MSDGESASDDTVESSGQVVNIDGRSYDICVMLSGSNRVLLLVDNLEDVKAAGLLEQAAAAKAGCPGCLEDEEEGIYWPSGYPLRKEGCYIFYPRLPRQGIGVAVERFLDYVVHLARVFTTPADPLPSASKATMEST